MLHNPNNIRTAGVPLEEASKVMIMVHGRGGSARDILSLSEYIEDKDFAFIAPEAQGNTWYPYSFLSPFKANEPYLSSALEVLASLRARLQSDFNFKPTQIYWLGFSQGACLALEFVARNASEYGGVFGLSGGLIGPPDTPRQYEGSLLNTPIFLGCSDIDSHIPKERVLESDTVFRQMGAKVTTKLYTNFPHTINEDELKIVNLLIAGEEPPASI
ncbi:MULTISPECIES: dienelactone hydrolase family protein [unclassified Spirosoma]|uniref:alpha/beta hydrolase n=1 Tax=unclassified Spirosoma TaxID=2621999 RepID=UPI0009601132|nr:MULTISPECIES: dienelactone hydrolase family protein [unclassified Spirosoma]MBN8823961.1 dienelactone hydrolase family protein [Spirosoma sp.]OJW70374.1 MAG: phospholipase [Spirosoma sp. 48-14]